MLRFLMIIAGCVCTTVVVSETTALIVLWQRGMVSAHHLREIRLVLTNRTVNDEKESDRDQKPEFPSSQQLAEARAIKTLNFDKRESELITLKGMADDKREDLESLQKQFRAQRKMFDDELARIETELTSTSTEQARGVLLALAPKDAVRQLLQLTLAEDVVLLKGMPEKTVAKILKEFSAAAPAPAPPPTADSGADRKESPAERGRRIFEALTRGEPVRTLLEQTRKDNASNPADSSD
jgi:flagellar motility protein MotE (MotC chaperone)